MKSKEMPTEIIMVVDKSGSMDILAKDTIDGYNRFISEQKEKKVNANINTLFFDTTHGWFQKGVPVEDARRLDADSYRPEGGTSLNDAIGRAYHLLEYKNPKRAIVVIITDGEENSSKEITQSTAKNMLADIQRKDFKVLYLAANQDAFKVGASFGIQLQGVANIPFNSKGINTAYASASTMASNYASTGHVGYANLQNLVDSKLEGK